MASVGSALRSDYINAHVRVGTGTTGVLLSIPPGVKVLVDGAVTPTRPVGRPAIVQAFDDTGKVLLSGWYTADAPLTIPPAPPGRRRIQDDGKSGSDGDSPAVPHGPNRPL